MSAVSARPSSHLEPNQDSFLSARINNARRNVAPRRPSHASNAKSLDAVPEDGDVLAARTAAPTAYRTTSDMSHRKGKGRDMGMSRSESTESMTSRKRADWVIDLLEVSKGSDRWAERERVVLVIGSPTADALSPILSNPAFSNTLLLVGTVEPSPSIEALTSPSYLLHNASEQSVYPTVQPFSLSQPLAEGQHALPLLLEQASALAIEFRNRTFETPRKRLPPRRGSGDSAASSTPPLTPPTRGSPGMFATDLQIRTSMDSAASESTSRPFMADIVKSPSELSLTSRRTKSRIGSMNFSRESIFGAFARSDSDAKPWTGGSPIDAVVNFVPPASDFASQRAMQEMLHQAVVLTTGVLPVLTRRSTKPSTEPTLPISLLHVLPSQVPHPLPGVMESFLLSLLPSFANKADREVVASVITLPVWNARPRDIEDNELHSGSEILLFGGLRCAADTSNSDVKLRAFLSNWRVCVRSPGSFASSQPQRPVPLSLRSDPPSIGYASVDARTPPSFGEGLRATNHPRNPRATSRPLPDAPTQMPDLDPSSSASSVSGEPVGPLSEESHGESDKRSKGGLVGWLRRKNRK